MGARQIKNRVVLLSHASDFIEIANCQRGRALQRITIPWWGQGNYERSESMSSIDMIMRQHIKTIFFLQDEICKIDLENSRRWGE